MTMPSDDKARVARMAKLLELAEELHAKQHDVLRELASLASGGDGQGDKLKRLYARYSELWCARYEGQQQYAWSMPQDAALMKRLLKIASEAEIIGRMEAYLGDDETLLRSAHHPFKWFVVRFNRLSAPREDARQQRSEQHRTWAERCRHDPTCGSESQCALITSRECPHTPRCTAAGAINGSTVQAACLTRINDGDWGLS
jgi:hypothetical protein